MLVVTGFDHVPQDARGGVLAIGNFDGVHRGHQALLTIAMDEARRRGRRAGAICFEPHPRVFFAPEKPLFPLTTPEQKLDLFRLLGLDLAVRLGFDARLAAMPAEEFIERVLVAGLGVGHVVIGFDFFFGKGRTGSPEIMTAAGKSLGFGVEVVAPVAEQGEVFSSSSIRARLAQGDVRGAAAELGYWWRVSGTVVGGAHRGTGLGYPTANLRLAAGTALAHGIYASRVTVGGRHHLGATYLGRRPTFDNGLPVLETFLLDFDGDLYGREMTVEFIAWLRPDQGFRGADALKAQMDKDVAAARSILAELAAADPMRAFPLGRALADLA